MSKKNPWAWVPTLYFAEGLPYVAVMTISLIMYKRLGLSNADITLYTSWLYLPWVIKPLWSPFIDIIKTKRWWIVVMQLLIGASLGGVAFTIPGPYWLQGSLAFFWLMAFSSATHDIAADGFYMLGLDEHKQAYFVGIRSTFYRIATIVGQGRALRILNGTDRGMEANFRFFLPCNRIRKRKQITFRMPRRVDLSRIIPMSIPAELLIPRISRVRDMYILLSMTVRVFIPKRYWIF